MKSLDLACAKVGHEIASALSVDKKKIKDAENLIRKSLGTLQEMGIYAHFLYLAAEKGDMVIKILQREAQLLKNPDLYNLSTLAEVTDRNSLTNFLASVESAFPKVSLLFAAKDMLERTLTYALYELKSLIKEDTNKNEQESST